MNAKLDLTETQINSPRLLLRPWQDADAADLFEVASADVAEEMIGRPRHKTLADSQRAIEAYREKKNCFAIEHKADKKVIGYMELHGSWAGGDPRFAHLTVCELGTFISKTYWGGGIAAEAGFAAVDFCFNTLGLDAVTVCHFVTNSQSGRVIEKMGFEFMQESNFHSRSLNRDFMEKQYIKHRSLS